MRNSSSRGGFCRRATLAAVTSRAGREGGLRIYADRGALPEGTPHVAMLYPLWGAPPENPEDPSHGRYDRLVSEGTAFFTLSPLEAADVVLFPVPWEIAKDRPEAVEEAQRLSRLAAEHEKPFLIFFWSDSAEPVPIEPSIVFRTSLYRSRRQPNELAMPAWSEDFLERYLAGEQAIRPRLERPLVGFCGFDAPPSRTSTAIVKRLLGRPIMSPRGRALAALAASKEIDTRFVVRDRFFGDNLLPSGQADYGVMQRVRQQYVENMIETDYALAVRGDGNFSYRLYEILSCGRPPLFVNTDCVVPFDRELDWKRFTVWVDESELDSVADRLVEFHAGLDDDSFADLQHRCRQVWLDFLSPQGFFRHLHLHFRRDGDGRLRPATP